MRPERTRQDGTTSRTAWRRAAPRARAAASAAALLILLAGTAVSAVARAQDAAFERGPGFDPRLLRPSTDRFGFASTEGSGTLAWGEYDLLLGADYAAAVAPLGTDPNGIVPAPEADLPLIDDAVSGTLGAQLGLLPRGQSGLSIGAALPVLVLDGPARTIEGSYDDEHAPLRSQGLGAPALMLKWSPLNARRSGLGLALLAQADFALGDSTLRADPDVVLWPRLVIDALSDGGAAVSFNVGYRVITGEGPLLTSSLFRRRLRHGDQLTIALSGRVQLWGPLQGGLAFNAAQLIGAWGRKRVLASELLAALRLPIATAAVVQLGGGAGLTNGWNEPDGRVFASVALTGGDDDPDGDGVLGDDDACPASAEDFDLTLDQDGCPEPDNDADGVPDASDVCPDDAGCESNAGCPRRALGDQDNDGFDDYRDACPSVPGTAGGCPAAPQLNPRKGSDAAPPRSAGAAPLSDAAPPRSAGAAPLNEVQAP